MNCKNCGAPLTPVGNGDHFVCTHCDTHQFLETLADSKDGIVLLGEPGKFHCPLCDGQPLVRGALSGVAVEYCEICRGLLIDSGPLPSVLAERRSRNTFRETRPTPLNPDELQRHIRCPACETFMDVHPYHGPGNAVIDSCYQCRKIWLDQGEFAVLLRAPGR